MKRKKISRKDMLSSCGQIGPEDGVDPRVYFRKHTEGKVNRKVVQLCSEVARTLSHVFEWELRDDLLDRLRVESVVPAPHSARLLVVVSLPVSPGKPAPADVLERLHRIAGRLRAEVAAAVCRRRAPELVFHVEIREEAGQGCQPGVGSSS